MNNINIVVQRIILLLKFFLIFSLVSGCAAIQANKIKIEDFPKINQQEIDNISLKLTIKENVNPNADFAPMEFYKIDGEGFIKSRQTTEKFKCVIKSSYVAEFPFDPLCQTVAILTGLTLFIVPAYCPYNQEIKATLIAVGSDSKEKELKSYHFKDKVHDIVSLLWGITTIFIGDTQGPNQAKSETYYRLSQALARQVIHDANQFEECKKTQNQPNKITNKN